MPAGFAGIIAAAAVANLVRFFLGRDARVPVTFCEKRGCEGGRVGGGGAGEGRSNPGKGKKMADPLATPPAPSKIAPTTHHGAGKRLRRNRTGGALVEGALFSFFCTAAVCGQPGPVAPAPTAAARQTAAVGRRSIILMTIQPQEGRQNAGSGAPRRARIGHGPRRAHAAEAREAPATLPTPRPLMSASCTRAAAPGGAGRDRSGGNNIPACGGEHSPLSPLWRPQSPPRWRS